MGCPFSGHFLLFLFLSLKGLASISRAQSPDFPLNNASASAIFVFGDSTVDPGNNNYVMTTFKSNFPPYGKDFEGHIPTGRFTNGRLVTDMLASYLGLKDRVPAYLDPTLSLEAMMTGVSFASAGCGYDPLTASISNVIPPSKQLEYFKEYKARMEAAFGKAKLENILKDALFILSAGTNDFVINYYTLPIRRKQFTVASYRYFLLQQTQNILQDLWKEGVRRIGVVGLPPLGCLPLMITLKSDVLDRSCIETYSAVARDYNKKLQNQLKSMQIRLSNYGARITYLDIYSPLIEMIRNPIKFGFEEVCRGCCGTGLLEASLLCNPKSFLCVDASKYLFWDSIHPTDMGYYFLYEALQATINSILRN